MDQEEPYMIEELHERCGEIFLSIKGNLIFICTICEYQTKDFDGYTDHISTVHYTLETVEEDDTADQENWYQENEVEEIELVQTEPIFEDFIDVASTVVDVYENVETLEEEPEVEPKASQMENFVRLHTVESFENVEVKIETVETSPESTEVTKLQSTNRNNKAKEVPSQPAKRRKLPPDSVERKHKCTICGFGFRDYSNLQSHIRRHSDDKKNHACSFCSKRFFSSTELVSHVRRHTKERPFLCTKCGQTFVTNSTLNEHQKRHLNIRNSICKICSKTFYDNTLLKEHMISHNGERAFSCSVCDAKFARRKALICHAKLHENKREYQCDLCPASFNQGPGLYSHLRNKHQLDKSTISNYRAIITKDHKG